MPSLGFIKTNKLANNILGASLYKGINIIFTFLLVRYTVAFVGEETYGVLLAILSVFTWFSAFEVGVSSSFRNQLTNYFSDAKNHKVRLLIIKSYKILSVIYTLVFILIILLLSFCSIESLLTPSESKYGTLNLVFGISLFFYFVHYIFFFLNTILLATHNSKYTFLIIAIQNGIILFGIVLFTFFKAPPSLLLICIWFSIVPPLVWGLSTLYSFKNSLNEISVSTKQLLLSGKNASFKGLNKGFFIIQICTLIIFSTDNIIIVNQLTGSDVSKYNIAFKYFNILTVIFNLILVPYWASFTEAAHKNDKLWIQKNIKVLIYFWIGICLLSIVMLSCSAFVYKMWLGKDLGIPLSLSIVMCLSVLLTAWNGIFAYFLNAVSQVSLQMKVLIFSALINVPLSFLFIRYLDSTGVILATVVSLLPLSIALPLQVRSIIKRMS